MLTDGKAISLIGETLRKDGTLDAFEEENGPILGRVMIVEGKVPEGIEAEPSEFARAFICSFDFYDAELGIVLDLMTKKPLSRVWINSQIEDADTPSEEWVDFFIEKLLSGIAEDGNYGMPICSFVNNSTDLTVVPSLDSKLMAGNDD